MNVRWLLSLALPFGLLAAPLGADAQQPAKIPKIGLLFLLSGPNPNVDAFQQGLRELGWIEGQNIAIEYRWAAGREDRLPALAAELVRLKVAVIVTAATPTIRAAGQATRTIPIVAAAMADPMATELIASLGRPGGNVTGLSLLTTDLAGKRLQLLKEVAPHATRVAVLALQGSPATAFLFREVEAAARVMGIQPQLFAVRGPQEFESAFAAMRRGRTGALIVQASPLSIEYRAEIAILAAKHKLPAIYKVRTFAEVGGLMSYGPDLADMYRRAATYVDKILKGAKPADLPVEQPTRFELVLNLKTAKALGLTIPQSVLIRADQVIQ